MREKVQESGRGIAVIVLVNVHKTCRFTYLLMILLALSMARGQGAVD
jgi:hypothetical protein